MPPSENRAWFACIAGCEGHIALDEFVTRCPRCDDLLEVVHDTAALAKRDAAGWKSLFDQRLTTTASGVWNKKEWVQPHVRDENIVSLGEGNTHLLFAERLGKLWGLENLWVKQCGNSHSGSFKDLGMTVLVSTVKQMIADGRTVPAIACASTGDTSASLAAYAAAAGLRAIVLLPQGKTSLAQLLQPLAAGARVLAIDTDFDGCMAYVKRLAAEEGVYLANSMNSLRLEGQKTVAIEIAQQLGWQVPDWIIIPGGNLGNVSALGAGFTMLKQLGLVTRLPRICVAQAERANPLYRAFEGRRSASSAHDGLPWTVTAMVAQTTLASAIQIGNPVSAKKAVRVLERFEGIVEQASEAELADAAAQADLCGVFACPQTGVALAAVRKLRARNDIRKHDQVVVISTASALKFSDFKEKYHAAQLLDVPRPEHANAPHKLSDDYVAVRDEVRRSLAE